MAAYDHSQNNLKNVHTLIHAMLECDAEEFHEAPEFAAAAEQLPLSDSEEGPLGNDRGRTSPPGNDIEEEVLIALLHIMPAQVSASIP